MRLSTKTPGPTPERAPPGFVENAENKGKSCAPKQARLTDCLQQYAKTLAAATLTATLAALATVLCLAYTALNPTPCLYARAWCGAVMVLAPVALRRLQLPEHEFALAAAGLAALASHASAASKDALCILVLGAGSVHAMTLYWHEANRQHRFAVVCCLAGVLLSTSVLTLALWGEMDPHTTAAVLAAFLALYVASLFMAKLA
jgi:hypothetical protein